MSITNTSNNMTTTNSSSNALYSNTDRALLIQIRIAPFLVMFSCSFIVIFLIALRRCTRKDPSAENDVAISRDIAPVPQEQVIWVDCYDLERLNISEYYHRLFPGRVFLSSSATNDFDEDVGVPLHED
jgi:hypothetical protein